MIRCSGLFACVLIMCMPLTVLASGKPKYLATEAGIDAGGLVLGADLLINDTSTESYGGYVRLYSKDESKNAPALFALGVSGRGHLKSGIFEYYLSPGLGMIHHNLRNTEILFGPTLTYGLTADLNPGLAIGVENTKLYSWVGEFKGLMKDTFLAQLRFRL